MNITRVVSVRDHVSHPITGGSTAHTHVCVFVVLSCAFKHVHLSENTFSPLSEEYYIKYCFSNKVLYTKTKPEPHTMFYGKKDLS